MKTTESLKTLRAVYGSNLEGLAHSPSPYDKTLLHYLMSFPEYIRKLINQCEPNRGDMCETAHSATATNRTGKRVQSHGDMCIRFKNRKTLQLVLKYLGGECYRVEWKYISPKTKASAQLRGTTANAYIIVFADKEKIFTRLIKPSDLKTKNGQITFQDNANNGIEINLEDLILSPID